MLYGCTTNWRIFPIYTGVLMYIWLARCDYITITICPPHSLNMYLVNLSHLICIQIIKKKDYAGPPSAYRPIRARLAGQWEAGLKNICIIWISGRRRGGIVWVNPSSKCASCHSNEMHQRIIHTHVNVSSKAYVYDDTIYNFCARARFAGCTSLRHIILGLNTVYTEIFK